MNRAQNKLIPKTTAKSLILPANDVSLPSLDPASFRSQDSYANDTVESGLISVKKEIQKMMVCTGQLMAAPNPHVVLLNARISVLEDHVSTLLKSCANTTKRGCELDMSNNGQSTMPNRTQVESFSINETSVKGIQDVVQPGHSIAHTPGWTPLNCICGLSSAMNSVLDSVEGTHVFRGMFLLKHSIIKEHVEKGAMQNQD